MYEVNRFAIGFVSAAQRATPAYRARPNERRRRRNHESPKTERTKTVCPVFRAFVFRVFVILVLPPPGQDVFAYQRTQCDLIQGALAKSTKGKATASGPGAQTQDTKRRRLMREVLFYVSGHGYGHATRTSEILRALAVCRPDWTMHVRSNVPEHLMSGIERVQYHRSQLSLDPGVVEQSDSLGVDVPATLAAIERCYEARRDVVAAEVDWLKRHDISLIVADFPPLAGEVAAACGLPCIGIGNFTWDWIYEPLIDERRRPLLEWLRDGYRQMGRWLKLPFSHTENQDLFPRVIDVPLVARQPKRQANDVLQQLRISGADRRPRIVLGMRGRIPPLARRAAADANRDWLFLHFEATNAGSHGNELPVTLSAELLFTDVLNVCDIAVSKFGYGLLSECIATKKRLLCPPRRQFREDEIFEGQIDRHLLVERIAHDEFAAGRWSAGVRRLLERSPPEPSLATDGAEACAREIAAW